MRAKKCLKQTLPLQKACSVMTNLRMYHNIVINYLFTCSQHTHKVWVGQVTKHTWAMWERNASLTNRGKQKMSKVDCYNSQFAHILRLALWSLELIRKQLKPTKHPQLVSDQTSSGSNFWDQSRWIILQAQHKGALEYLTLGGRSGVFMGADV